MNPVPTDTQLNAGNRCSPRMAHVRRRQQGSYAILMAFVLIVVLGFGALAVDMAYIRLAQQQTQDIADAASQAAIFRLRRSGDLDDARNAAALIAANNKVAGYSPVVSDVTFGQWDHRAVPRTFTTTNDSPNAVRVQVERTGDNHVGLFLARLFGWDSVDVVKSATSATEALHVILVMDITGSWSQTNFRNARDAALAFLDVLESGYGDYDMFGMTIFSGRYAWEYTPMTYIADEVASGAVRAEWMKLNVASKGGTGQTWPAECVLKPNSPSGQGSARNVFTSPDGGCYPDMPREYTDEPGTDHTVGLLQAEQMFDEQVDPTAFRALVMLTDGIPNGLAASHGTYRNNLGYTESRWREELGVVPHTTAQVKAEANTLTQSMYTDSAVNTYVVSFVKDDPFMWTMPKGIGYYANTSDSAALVPIFEDIANSLPMAIVQ
jgi:Flp pilus assembly protein TadG